MKKTKINLVVFAIVLIALLPSKIIAQWNQPQWVVDKYQPLVYNFVYSGVNQSLAYRILKPINFDASKKYPVVVTLHNASGFSIPGSRDYNINNLRAINGQFAGDSIQSKYPTYVIALQADKFTSGKFDMWNKKHFEGAKQIIAALAPNVDINRIYVMGQSAGGHGTNLFISYGPTYFAAAIAASAEGNKISLANRDKLVNFNLWTMHGSNDTTSPYSSDVELFTYMKSKNAKMKFTTFIGRGHSTEDFLVGSYGATGTVTKSDTDEVTGVVTTKTYDYTTEYASAGSDPEANTLYWLFSKSLLGTAALNKKRATQKPTINFDLANSELNYSAGIDQIIVYNLNGSAVLKAKKPSGNTLDLSSLKAGLYIVKTYQENGDVGTTKIMK
ncbi:T9SS type A sorting domain-containing protein [Flavobacterium luteum]|uniref:T9SS type A sorting domain-containing protein n=1 Tax=Flavobacterium luteum TaxID=2026654 RepID=A0A7J5A9A3_9FLAO|nr:T9SS type A sorting domain-containing protein [Flavobacterium luteum]KAB1154018.1 T9SS type A sorting domain-containing protein [Flavobacterium luteum]